MYFDGDTIIMQRNFAQRQGHRIYSSAQTYVR